MHNQPFSSRIRRFTILGILTILAASSLSCQFMDLLRGVTNEDRYQRFLAQETQNALETSEAESLIFSDNSESVLEESGSYGSGDQGSSETKNPEPAAVPDPVLNECGEAGYCTAVYPVDIRGTANPPEVMVFANSAEYPSPAGFSVTFSDTAGPWYEWIVLREIGDAIQAASPAGYTSVGIQFWGDQTNGWTRVTLDGVEVWRGDTTAYGTDGVNYFVYVEFSGVEPGPHTLAAELIGQPGAAGGDNVPVFYFAYRK